MLTYQVRPRILRFEGNKVPDFPASGTANFYLQPQQPFGTAANGGRTAVRAVKASSLFNANTGVHTIESADPLEPLEVRIEEPNRVIELNGQTLSVSQDFQSAQEMMDLINGIAYVMPSLINISFYDPPYVERVNGVLNGVKFRWELREWNMRFGTTTQSKQEKHIIKAWERLGLLSEPNGRRRLTAGLHYFYMACRLGQESMTAGEFMAEAVLNFAKSLEAVFPPSGDGMTREAVRRGLRSIGYEDAQIERDFLPAMALRDNIDVAHVGLSFFTMDQLRVIHEYVERSETAFREMFERLISAVENGDVEIESYSPGKPSKDVQELVERIQESTDNSSDKG